MHQMIRSAVAPAMLSLAVALAGCESQPSPQTLKYRGDLAMEKRDYATAVEWYQQYFQRIPVDAEARYSLGTAYLGLGQPAMAREEFILGMETDTDVTPYIEGIASALVAMGQRDELFRLLRRQAEQTRNPDDFIRYGKFAALVGDIDVAEEALLTAARIDEGRTLEPQLALADLYRSIGDGPRELSRLRMALFIDPENEEISARIAELGEVAGPAFVLQPVERQ
ncbi:MAG: tetratricopeptide repeat protein [Phycisphaerales bacterium]